MRSINGTCDNRRGSLIRLPAVIKSHVGMCVALGLGLSVSAAEYTVQTLSDSSMNSRDPVITETKLVVWSAYFQGLGSRVDQQIVIHTGRTMRTLFSVPPADVGASLRPQAQSNHVVWVMTMGSQGGGESWKLRQVPQPDRDQPVAELPAIYRPVVIEPATQVWQEVMPEELETGAVAQAVSPLSGEAAGGTEAPLTQGAVISNETGETKPSVGPIPPVRPVPAINAPSVDESVLDEKPRRYGSGDTEIFFWRGEGSVIQITQDNRDDLGPSVWGNLVAWQTAKGWPFGWEIMVWTDGQFIQLTTNFYYDMAPRVHGERVVWYGWDGHDFEIFMYDHSKDTTIQITSNLYDDISPDIWGDVIVWEGYASANADIFMWQNGMIKKLSTNVEDDLNPRVWNGQVVWQGFDGEDFEIYHFNGETTVKLTSNTYDDVNPDIRNGVICWMGYEGNWDAEIYVWDGGPDARRLTENEDEDRNPRTAAGCVVWESVSKTQSVIQLAIPKI